MAEPFDLPGWDDLDISEERLTEKQKRELDLAREFAGKYHRLFKQNPEGAELLAHWTDSVLMQPIVQPDDSQFAAGIREGMARLIRGIHQQIKFAEHNQ